MAESPQDWQGKVIDGFPLRQYVSERGGNFVFVTEHNGQRAAIKLIAAPAKSFELQLSRLQAVMKLSHPHLVRTFAAGTCTVNGQKMLYVITEYADEDLSQVLPVRALTVAEAEEMTAAVVDALSYLHANGFAHGHIKPSNIMVAGEQIKLSTDGMCRTGERVDNSHDPGRYAPPELVIAGASPSADVWSFGMTLVEALTQRLPSSSQDYRIVPASLPEPLQQIARNCLHLDYTQRWTTAQISARLRESQVPVQQVQPAPPSRKWVYAAAVIVLAAAASVIGSRVLRHPVIPPHTAATSSTSASRSESNLPPAPAATVSTSSTPGAILHKVVPDVPKSARNTVHGIIKVRVRVDATSEGNVAKTRLQTAGPSKYFARLATQASEQWKFTPPQRNGHSVASAWTLLYEFTRGGATVEASPLNAR